MGVAVGDDFDSHGNCYRPYTFLIQQEELTPKWEHIYAESTPRPQGNQPLSSIWGRGGGRNARNFRLTIKISSRSHVTRSHS